MKIKYAVIILVSLLSTSVYAELLILHHSTTKKTLPSNHIYLDRLQKIENNNIKIQFKETISKVWDGLKEYNNLKGSKRH